MRRILDVRMVARDEIVVMVLELDRDTLRHSSAPSW